MDERIISLVERSQQDAKAHADACARVLRNMENSHRYRSIVVCGVTAEGVVTNYHIGERGSVFEIIGSLEMLKKRIMDERTERIYGEDD